MRNFALTFFATLLLCALFLCAVSGTAQAGELTPPHPATAPIPSRLTLRPVPGLTIVDRNTYRYDAGVVDVIRTPRLERTFTLENDGKQPVTIARLRGSCGCEELRLLRGGKAVPSTRLDPGETATLHLAINLHGGQSGPTRKYLWVDGPEAAGQTLSLALLEVDLSLRQSVSFAPASLNFGKVEAGTGAALPLTVSLDSDLLPDPGLLPDSALPLLQSADPDLQVERVGPLQRVEEGGKERLRQAFQVLLSPTAHAGHLSGDLRFTAPRALAGSLSLLAGVSVPVTGTVTGALDAIPATVFFGSLPAGKPVRRSVVLSSVMLGSLSASGDAPWLQATLAPADPSAKHRLLTVTLTARAPLGPLQGKVTVTTARGERLDIPVIAELTKSGE